ncbi:MAG TPA: sulfurtransferase TusA family protein [Azospirillaceae bacterium]|nr:sulfurtransferase TusA family protein [Azospirillaceae bacterium]
MSDDPIPPRILDVKGLHCPLPILRTRKTLNGMTEGEELVVYVTDPASGIDFRHFCNTSPHQLLEAGREGEVFIYRIRCGGAKPAGS